jgi:hypothetical protein
MDMKNNRTVDVQLEDGSVRIGYVGSVSRIWDTHNAEIYFTDHSGLKHCFKTTDKCNHVFREIGNSGNPLMRSSGHIGFPDSLQDKTVFVLSRGRVVAYGSYNDYLLVLDALATTT